MLSSYIQADYVYMVVSFVLSSIAVVRAGVLDSENIFSNQTSNYLILTVGLVLMFTEYILHPELAIANMITLAVYSATVSMYTAFTTRRIFGSIDILFTHLYIFSTPPVIFGGVVVPYSAVTVLSSTFVAIYLIYYRHRVGVPFLTLMAYAHLLLVPVYFYSVVLVF